MSVPTMSCAGASWRWSIWPWRPSRQVGLDARLTALGFNGPQQAAAIGTLIARMMAPGSELATLQWLQQRRALGELIDFDFTRLDLLALYRIADRLLAHKAALESFLYARECDLFGLDEVITLYDLTNTYFEGTARTPTASIVVASPWELCGEHGGTVGTGGTGATSVAWLLNWRVPSRSQPPFPPTSKPTFSPRSF